jgi:hypothetical protein
MADEKKVEEKSTGNEIIKLDAAVKVTATEKAKHLKSGETYEVHPKQAEALIKKGWAKAAK